MESSKNALFLSIFFHALIFIILITALRSYSLYGLSQPQVSINAYLSHNSASTRSSSVKPQHPLPATQNIPNEKSRLSASSNNATTASSEHAINSPLATETKQPAPAEIQKLLSIIAHTIQEHLQYPALAKSHIQQGQSLVQFELAQNGNLQNIEVIKSSGTDILDEAAIKAIMTSSPISIPENIKVQKNLTLRVPVHFNMQ